MITIPDFENKNDLFAFLKANKETLISQKKSTIKHTDSFNGSCFDSLEVSLTDKPEHAEKANLQIQQIPDEYKVKVVMNTTNIVDSHNDLHVNGLWKKTISENKNILHVQEHKSEHFNKIIASDSDLKVYTQQMSWNELGEIYTGTTEALIFESTLKRAGQKPRNEFMAEQYANGYVKQHSVGMIYVKIYMAINSTDAYYAAEKDTWDKYYSLIVNKEKVDSQGYFWVVTEAKLIEGSAVTLGSNRVTPTLDNNLKTTNEQIENTAEVKIQPSNDTESNKPSNSDTYKELTEAIKYKLFLIN